MCVSDCHERITAREAVHLPYLTVVYLPIHGSKARRPLVLCPYCKARKWYLYRGRDSSGLACAKCANLTYRSSQRHCTKANFNEALADKNSIWFKRWKELFYPVCFAALEENEAADLPNIIAHCRAEREAEKRVTVIVKREWVQAQRAAKKPRTKN